MQEEKSSSDSFRDEVGKMTTIEQLAEAAHGVNDDNNDGSGSKEHEDIVIAAILPMLGNVKEAVEFSKTFGTTTGRHRLLQSYVEKNGVATEDDTRTLLGGIYTTSFQGKELKDAIISAATAAGIETDKPSWVDVVSLLEKNLSLKIKVIGGGMFDSESPFAKGLSGIIISGSGFPDLRTMFGTEEAKDEPCECIDCQIERASQESPENAHIQEQWHAFKGLLIAKGLFAYTDSGYGISHPDIIKQEMEGIDLDERLRKILLDELAKAVQSQAPSMASMSKIIQAAVLKTLVDEFAARSSREAGAKKTFMSPEELDNILGERQQVGQLDRVGFPFIDRIYSLKDLLDKKREEIPPEIIAVLEKYAALQSSEKPTAEAG